ncbi:hypothetical protein [Chryseobacterium koreense]|uniref:hypothetical protein n=1 Tax=Chryseobacterium koreense TaxID=232216 RepID=UPI00161A4092|nr:hypothetical protein [Chryseobacterium koreense]MBB5332899.1 hypothetical protein [Chryseobacterium koreense]
MSTNIIYKNNYGIEIPINQALQLEEYSKYISIDNKLKKIEAFENGIVNILNYYLDINEDSASVLSQYINIETVVLIKSEQLFNCIKEEGYTYEGGQLTGRTVSIIKDNQTICFRLLNLQEQPLRTTKYFYENGEEKYDFEYNEDGTCFMIYKNNEFGEDILAANIGQPGVNFSWDEVGDYYKNANPIIPW